MENILIDALKINDLKLAGAKSTPQNTDSNSSFESILQGLLGTGANITKSKHAGPFTHKGTTSDIGLKENLETLSELINKISKQLETNEGELDIAALEELIGRSLSEDETSFFQMIANKDFSLEDLQTALLEGNNPELQTMGLSIDFEKEEPLQLKIKKLIAGLDKIVKEIDQVLENKLNSNLTAEESNQTQENIKGLLAVFESVKGKLQQIDNDLTQNFTLTNESLFEGYDDIDKVKKTFWTTIDQLMGNKSQKGGDSATANLLSNEIISNGDLRDLRKNMENLLQNRESLQKLFTSDSSVDRKFVSAVLNYADALKENKGKTGIAALAKNLAALNQESAKVQPFTAGNGLFKELLTDNLEKDNSNNPENKNNSGQNKNFNSPFSLNNVQVLKAETSAPASTNTPVNYSSILKQVSEKINYSLGKGESRVTIQLNPRALGQVNVDLSMKNNQLQAIIVADSVQAKNILESNINQLKIALEGNNIEIDKVSVFVGNEENNFASQLREHKNSQMQKQNFKTIEDTLKQEISEDVPRVIISDKSENLDLFV
jgi:flagellar hook-length control protein FliK